MSDRKDLKDLIEQIRRFHPWNEQERKDQKRILQSIEEVPDIFFRENETVHMTASAWVVNPARDKVLMVYHNIYNSWSWLGGHADGEEDLLTVAIKEVQEESGLKNIRALSDEIFSIEVLTVDGHVKKGQYVSSHLHLNVTYLIEADDRDALFEKEDENAGLKWFGLDEAIKASSESWFRENIYSKLNAKLGAH